MISQTGYSKFVLALLLCLLSTASWSQKAKNILKNLENEDFEEALKDLQKFYERDSIDPTLSYYYAELYATDSFPGYSLDTARLFALRAIELVNVHGEDYNRDLEKMELNPEDFTVLKRFVDSLAYAQALATDSESAYLHYLLGYTDSEYISAARKQLEVIRYNAAAQKNTWQAYRYFFETNPKADQVKNAKNKFNELVYQEKTNSGKLEDLEDFLIEFPATPFRRDVESKIFSHRSARLNPEEIYAFINAYNNPGLSKKGFGVLYHLGVLDPSKLKSFNIPMYEFFRDSAAQVELLNYSPLVTFYEDDMFHFADLNGRPVVPGTYEEVDPLYLCQTSLSQVFSVRNGKTSQLVNRNGNVVAEHVEAVEHVGDGILVTQKNGLFGAVHITGFEIIPHEYTDIEWLGSKLFRVSKGGAVWLVDFSDQAVTDSVYDNIYLAGKFWIFEKSGQLAITNYEEINRSDYPFTPDFSQSYEEVELFDEKYLIAFDNQQEVMYNEQLEILTPPQTERINTRYDNWVFQMAEGYWIFDKEMGESTGITYDEVQQNEEWLALRRNNQWEVYAKNLQGEPILAIDSVKLLGQDIAIVFRSSQGMAVFPNKEIVYIEEGEDLRSLLQTPGSESHFMVRKSKGTSRVYRDGIKLFESDYDDIGFISEKAFSVQKYGKYGAVDDQGRLVMRIRYDAIGRAINGVASVLYKGKFGGFNFDDNVLIALDFDNKLAVYSDSLFRVRLDGQYGIINKQNKIIVTSNFEQIEYWSDSIFLGKQQDKWSLVDMKNGKKILKEMETYRLIKNNDQEKILQFRTLKGTGIFHSNLGQIIPPVFSDIINLGTTERPFYFAERDFPEADYTIVAYYNERGEKVKTAAYKDRDFVRLLCEDY